MANCKLLPPFHPFSPLPVAMFNEGKFLHFEILRLYGYGGGLPIVLSLFNKPSYRTIHQNVKVMCVTRVLYAKRTCIQLVYKFKSIETYKVITLPTGSAQAYDID